MTLPSYQISSPLRICHYVTKKGEQRWFTLNLNTYRNTQAFVLNKAKQLYTDTMLKEIEPLPVFNKIRLTYTVYTGSSHKSDVMNWASVVDKFFQDTMVKAGKLIDENYQYVPEVISRFGGIDKVNPRVEILIEPIE